MPNGRLGIGQLGDFVLGSTGEQQAATWEFDLTLDAVIALDSDGFSVDAVVSATQADGVPLDAILLVPRASSWSIDAETILPYSTTQHHREHDHFGAQNDTVIVYNGQTLDVVLATLYDSVDDLG